MGYSLSESRRTLIREGTFFAGDDNGYLSSSPALRESISIEQPYISQRFVSDKSSVSSKFSTTVSTLANRIAYCQDTLFPLGVMLLELCIGEALEEQHFRDQYLGRDKKPNAFADRSTAKEWQMKASRQTCLDGMSDVIRRCIDCSFSPTPDLTDEDFRTTTVYSGVVKPLQENLMWLGI